MDEHFRFGDVCAGPINWKMVIFFVESIVCIPALLVFVKGTNSGTVAPNEI